MKHSIPHAKSLNADTAREVVAAALTPYADLARSIDVRVEYDANRTWLVATLHNGRVLFVSERGATARSLDLCIDTLTELLVHERGEAVQSDRPSRVIVKNHNSDHTDIHEIWDAVS